MNVELSIQIGAALFLGIIVVMLLLRQRLGLLNTASWLVFLGAFIDATEHPLFAIAYSTPLPGIADDLRAAPMILLPHARIHFFMAGIYAVIGLGLLCVIARTLLLEGRRAGWYAVLLTVLLGGGFELGMGAMWFQHGSPLYGLFGVQSIGFGWQFLYLYFIAWIAALVISYPPVFAKRAAEGRIVLHPIENTDRGQS